MTRACTLYYSILDSDVGPITLVRTKKGLCRLVFGAGDNVFKRLQIWSKKHFLNTDMTRDDQGLIDVKEQVEQYFQGRLKIFSCELDLIGTPFQKQVWKALQTIPYGEVSSYKQVAQSIGAPKAVRAVGGANNKNGVPIIVPCHRVIGSNGALVGFASGLDIKKKLLHLEGEKHCI